jgi:putative glutamine amidotransferase
VINLKKVFILGNRDTWINYVNALEFLGLNVLCSDNIEDINSCSGLVLTGGGDVNPKLYSEENNGSLMIDNSRDEKESELIRRSFNKIPILGICRGHQILNVIFNGKLNQNIKTFKNHVRDANNNDNVHLVKATPSSYLLDLYGNEFAVNSSHHQAVSIPGEGFYIDAYSSDGFIEATSNLEHNIITTQWHPERMSLNKRRTDTVDGILIFEKFKMML